MAGEAAVAARGARAVGMVMAALRVCRVAARAAAVWVAGRPAARAVRGAVVAAVRAVARPAAA